MMATDRAINPNDHWTSPCPGTEAIGQVCAFYPEKQPVRVVWQPRWPEMTPEQRLE